MKFDKLDCKATCYDVSNKSNLMKVTLSIVHKGLNRKGTYISDVAIKNAEESIKNVPILGYVLRDEDGNPEDFDTHNVETDIVMTENGFDVKQRFIEVPLGVIPESCNPRYVDIDGVEYFQIDGYIWRSYSNDSYKLIEDSEFKSVSMEIKIHDGKFDDDMVFNINSYEYEGVTILGDHVLSGIEGANITKYSKYSDYKKTLEDIYKEIYSLESEVDSMSEITNEVVEEVIETEDATIEATEEVVDVIEETVEDTNEVIDETEVEDEVITEEVIEEVETTESDEVVETEEVTEVIEETEKVEEDPLEVFSILFDEIPGSLQEIAVKLHDRFDAINKELETLTKFKAEKDKEERVANVDEVISEFTELTNEDVESLRYDAIENKLDMATLKEKLASLAYSKIKANKKQSYSVDTVGIVPIIEKTEENGYEPYGGLFK